MSGRFTFETYNTITSSWEEFDARLKKLEYPNGIISLAPILEFEANRDCPVETYDKVRVRKGTSGDISFEGRSNSSGSIDSSGQKSYTCRDDFYDVIAKEVSLNLLSTTPSEVLSEALSDTDYTVDSSNATSYSIDNYECKDRKINRVLTDIVSRGEYIFRVGTDNTVTLEDKGIRGEQGIWSWSFTNSDQEGNTGYPRLSWETDDVDCQSDSAGIQEWEEDNIDTIINKVNVRAVVPSINPASVSVKNLKDLYDVNKDLNGLYDLRTNIDASKTDPTNVNSWDSTKTYNEGDWVKHTPDTIEYTYYCLNDETTTEPNSSDWEEMWRSSEGFPGIGGDFTGEFDGKGYKIKNLFMDRPNKMKGGLFHDIDGEVRNLRLVDFNMSLGGGSAPLASVVNTGGLVINCFCNGSIDINTSHYSTSAGLVRLNNGTIQQCISNTEIDMSDSDNDVGGLVGKNQSKVISCYAIGEIIENGSVSGALVYLNTSEGSIEKSFANSSTTGQDIFLIYMNDGSVDSVSDLKTTSEMTHPHTSSKNTFYNFPTDIWALNDESTICDNNNDCGYPPLYFQDIVGGTTIKVTKTDDVSISSYGERAKTYDVEYVNTIDEAQKLAEKRLSPWPDNKGELRVSGGKFTAEDIVNFDINVQDLSLDIDSTLTVDKQVVRNGYIDLTLGGFADFGMREKKKDKYSQEDTTTPGSGTSTSKVSWS